MRRHSVIFFLVFLATASLAGAQPAPRAPFRVGFIVSLGPPSSPQLEAFRLGLRELGYVEGKNIFIERRYAEGRLDRMAPFVREFVEHKVDVIMGVNNVVIRAAKEATRTIPIVAVTSIDPVAAGYVESFANPGGNITGLAWPVHELSGKRLELLKELLPRLSRVGILWDPEGPGPEFAFKEYRSAARAFKLELHSFEIREPQADLAAAFRAAKNARVEALIVIGNPLLSHLAKAVFELATKNRLPTMAEDRLYVDTGALMSYGTNVGDLYRRAAVYIDKILKGARPGELPMEEPNQFELVINHKTARQIGLTIAQTLLVKENK